MNKITIHWNKRKNKPLIEDIKEMLKNNSVEITNTTYKIANKLISEFENYTWDIYIGEDDEAPISREYFINYREYFKEIIKDAKMVYMDRNKQNGYAYPFAYVIFREKVMI